MSLLCFIVAFGGSCLGIEVAGCFGLWLACSLSRFVSTLVLFSTVVHKNLFPFRVDPFSDRRQNIFDRAASLEVYPSLLNRDAVDSHCSILNFMVTRKVKSKYSENRIALIKDIIFVYVCKVEL